MAAFQVMERGEGIEAAILRGLAGRGSGRWEGPAGRPALLVISPGAAGEEIAAAACRTVLLPGDAWGLPEGLRAASAVSYGLSPRDSLTLSSREGERLWCALQRELVTLDGAVVERQEFPVLPPPGLEPLSALAAAGALLLLGVPPERLRM